MKKNVKLKLNRETIKLLASTDHLDAVEAGCRCWSLHTDCKLGSCDMC